MITIEKAADDIVILHRSGTDVRSGQRLERYAVLPDHAPTGYQYASKAEAMDVGHRLALGRRVSVWYDDGGIPDRFDLVQSYRPGTWWRVCLPDDQVAALAQANAFTSRVVDAWEAVGQPEGQDIYREDGADRTMAFLVSAKAARWLEPVVVEFAAVRVDPPADLSGIRRFELR